MLEKQTHSIEAGQEEIDYSFMDLTGGGGMNFEMNSPDAFSEDVGLPVHKRSVEGTDDENWPRKMCNFSSHEFTTDLFTHVSQLVWTKLDASGSINPPQVMPIIRHTIFLIKALKASLIFHYISLTHAHTHTPTSAQFKMEL